MYYYYYNYYYYCYYYYYHRYYYYYYCYYGLLTPGSESKAVQTLEPKAERCPPASA